MQKYSDKSALLGSLGIRNRRTENQVRLYVEQNANSCCFRTTSVCFTSSFPFWRNNKHRRLVIYIFS